MRTLCIFSLLIFLASCGERKTIPERKLVKILSDMHIVDAALEQSKYNAIQRDSTATYTAILDEYGYTLTQLYSSMKVYSRSKKDADELYSKVCKRLEKQQKRSAKEVEKQQKEEDAESCTCWCCCCCCTQEQEANLEQ